MIGVAMVLTIVTEESLPHQQLLQRRRPIESSLTFTTLLLLLLTLFIPIISSKELSAFTLSILVTTSTREVVLRRLDNQNIGIGLDAVEPAGGVELGEDSGGLLGLGRGLGLRVIDCCEVGMLVDVGVGLENGVFVLLLARL